jgi:hypothetical protein
MQRPELAVRESPRNILGRFVSTKCPDPNCGGWLVYETGRTADEGAWRCNGLTYHSDTGPLVACQEEV